MYSLEELCKDTAVCRAEALLLQLVLLYTLYATAIVVIKEYH